MPKKISVSQAKNQLSAMLDWAIENQDGVIVESHGRPKAVILPFSQYESYLSFQEQQERQNAVTRLYAIAETIQSYNTDLSAEEADQLANEIAQEAVNSLQKDSEF